MQVLVLDFDCTLSQRCSYKTTHEGYVDYDRAAGFSHIPPEDRHKNKQFAEWIMGGKTRIKSVEKWFNNISKYCKIEICTWSKSEHVLSILKLTNFMQYIVRIHGRNGRSSPATVVENGILRVENKFVEKSEWLNNMKSSFVLFVDDNVSNYENANVLCFDNAANGLTYNNNGLTPDMMEKIASILHENHTCIHSDILDAVRWEQKIQRDMKDKQQILTTDPKISYGTEHYLSLHGPTFKSHK
jgi:hypothetical protein